MGKKWAVVKFPDEDDQVETVPLSWLSVENRVCYWPPYPIKQLKTAIQLCEEPNKKEWFQYKYIPFRNNIYESFAEATKKACKATKTSDLESSCTDQNQIKSKRKITYKKFESFSSLSETDNGDEFHLPMPPQPPSTMLLPTSIEREVQESQSLLSYSHNTKNSQSGCSNTSLVLNSPNTQGQREVELSQFSTLTTDQKFDIILKQQNNLIEKFKQQEIVMKELIKPVIVKQNILQSMTSDLLKQIEHIANKLENREVNRNDEVDSVFAKLEHLPVDREEHLEELENFLKNKSDYESLVSELTRFGGNSLYDFVSRALQKLITNQFAGEKYSFLGRRKKQSFRNLDLCGLLIKASLKVFPSETEKAAENEISKWLRRCTERAKHKKYFNNN